MSGSILSRTYLLSNLKIKFDTLTSLNLPELKSFNFTAMHGSDNDVKSLQIKSVQANLNSTFMEGSHDKVDMVSNGFKIKQPIFCLINI